MMRIASLLLLTACSDYGLQIKEPPVSAGEVRIDVDPRVLDFWSVRSGEQALRSFTVTSLGDGGLSVEALEIEGGAGFTLVDPPESFSLTQGEQRSFEVLFTPMEPEEQEGTVWVRSNDPDRPELDVQLTGSGLTPWLALSPEDHDFGERLVPCTDSIEVSMRNVGLDDLIIDDVASVGASSFTIDAIPQLPLRLSPGQSEPLTVTWTPSAVGASEGVIEVSSNDPRGVLSAVQMGVGQSLGEQTDDFTVTGEPPVDIIFAVDQSGSMDDDAASLAANFDAFLTQLQAITQRWRIGVVTYDSGCFNNGVLSRNSSDVQTLFAEAVSMGNDREIQDDEALFRILDRALQQTGDGDCNAGLLRDDALLHMIVVSDEPERSTEQASVWTWDWFQPRFEGYVSDPGLLKVSGVVDSETCNEGDDGYRQMIEATGGERLSICAGDWADYAQQLAEASLEFAWTFELSEQPVPESLSVRVDGAERSSGWTYESSLNAVVFEELLEQGQEVQVTYALASECP